MLRSGYQREGGVKIQVQTEKRLRRLKSGLESNKQASRLYLAPLFIDFHSCSMGLSSRQYRPLLNKDIYSGMTTYINVRIRKK